MADLRRSLAPLLPCCLLALAACGGGGEAAGERRPDLYLVLVDTIRWDHMSAAGYGRETTPVMDSLAADGLSWDRMQGQSGWTLPAMASILTGLSQREHGAGWSDGGFYGIAAELPTLQMLLGDAGYQTVALFNVIFMGEDFGFHRGFDHFDREGFVGSASRRDAAGTVDDFLAWYDRSRDTDRPLFAAIHFFDPHLPYAPPPPYDAMWTDPDYGGPFGPEWGGRDDVMQVNTGVTALDSAGLYNLTALYDGELAYTDAQLGRLLSELEARGAMEDAFLVVVGDHGEELMDHGRMGHGHTMYQELLHVPLIIAGPGLGPGEARGCAAHVDVLPTMLAMAGLEAPGWTSGADLTVGSAPAGRSIPSGNLVWSPEDLAAVLSGSTKVVGNPHLDSMVAYDLSADPLESSPVEPDSGSVELLLDYWATPPVSPPPEVPFREAMERTLRDLGYIR